jgi:hypothetical protein
MEGGLESKLEHFGTSKYLEKQEDFKLQSKG